MHIIIYTILWLIVGAILPVLIAVLATTPRGARHPDSGADNASAHTLLAAVLFIIIIALVALSLISPPCH